MLTTAQLQTLKADIAANTNTINGVQIKDMPNSGDANFAIAKWYSQAATPDFYVWRSNVSRADIYNSIDRAGNSWDWTTYKNQGVTEQNAWVQMFMGDQANFNQLNVRVGIGKIFTGSAGANAQRDHCLAVGSRLALRIEKLFASAVVNPPANTGNASGDALGATTNPALLGFEGTVSSTDIEAARSIA